MKKTRTKKAENKEAEMEYPAFSTVEEFEALSDAEKEQVDRYYTRKIPLSETRPLNKAEREQLDRIRKRGAGRPKIGQGAKVVAVTLEKGFLEQVDAYARRHSMKRAQMITQGLRLVMAG